MNLAELLADDVTQRVMRGSGRKQSLCKKQWRDLAARLRRFLAE
jgi:hypothetical protein